jgi:hypothetical protein
MGKEDTLEKFHRKGKYPFKWGNTMGKEKISWEREIHWEKENIVGKGKYYRKGKYLGKRK